MGGKLVRWQDRVYAQSGIGVRRSFLDGTLDEGFDMVNAPYFIALQGGDYHVYPDGRLLMSGVHQLDYPDSNWVGFYSLIWFTAEGYLDTLRTPRLCDGAIFEFEPLPGGGFICTGALSEYEGQPTATIFKIDDAGLYDPSFQPTLAWGEAYSFTPLPDGRILASGLFRTSSSTTDTTQFVRFMPDGSLDATFNNDLVVHSQEYGRFVLPRHKQLPDGRILLLGDYDDVDGQPRSGIALLDANGELLNTAFTGGGCGPYIYQGVPYNGTLGATLAGDSLIYIHGTYHGYDDGTTNDPLQRFVTRLYGSDYGMGMPDTHSQAFSLYPNPTSSNITLQLQHVPRNASVVVRDALGREVLHRRIRDYYTSLALEHTGVYMLELHDASGRIASERVVVE
ncbi:MAG: T9SS type A sorting domain-containing protein [Flavobacteriales bacterium]|nr:T9SS type A sorting domain-containing protein [Flavobacteriales bacterium]